VIVVTSMFSLDPALNNPALLDSAFRLARTLSSERPKNFNLQPSAFSKNPVPSTLFIEQAPVGKAVTTK
jgi:hypothetical protein